MNSEERSNEETLMLCIECEHIEGRCVCDCDDDVPSVPLPENRCGSCEQHIRVAVLGARLAAVERERNDERARRQKDYDWMLAKVVEQGAQRDAALARIAAVEALHSPKTFDGYSDWHHGDAVAALGAISPIRHGCTDKCFETFTVCNNDGAKWPCSTAAALAASPTPTGPDPAPYGAKFYPDFDEEPLIFVELDEDAGPTEPTEETP